MPSFRDYRRRIRGVQNTRKITHAMELVAATKMRRATNAVLATRRYAQLAWELLRDVQQREEVVHHPLLAGRPEVKRRLLLVITGNRGLVGAFNQNIAAAAVAVLALLPRSTDVVTAGRVAARLLQRAGAHIVADFPKKDLFADLADAAPIADFLLQRFLNGEADRVDMAYADFVSTTRHEPRVRTLLPLGIPDPALGRVSENDAPRHTLHARSTYGFLFEPDPESVLRAVAPNLISVQVYQALLETAAAEHAARMLSMKNATENADELVDDLTLTLNQVRQQRITRELQEIISGTLV